MQEGSETPSETSPPAAAEGGETVEISKEELRQLAEAAGIKVKTTSEIIQEERTARREAELEAARGPNAFTPFIEALKPVLELPPLIQYPVLLVIFGALSFPFSLLFGSGSLGDKMGVPSERGAPTEAAATQAAAPEVAPKKDVKLPTASDPTNSIAPKELQINRKSCDIFPYSLTPTCSDPNIGDKGVLKNLDKYTNQGWKEKAGITEGSSSGGAGKPAAPTAPADGE